MFRIKIASMNEIEYTFKHILEHNNNWELFKEHYKDTLCEHIIHETEKMLACGTKKCGYATYICTYCGEQKIIPFSCKSKLCSRCGKKHTDIWAHILADKLLFCEHRHIVLTISHKLWPFFINNPTLQKLLLNTAAAIIKKVFRTFSTDKNITPGFIMVLHPFGDDLKANFHVHILVTAGGLSKDQLRFIKVAYINYKYIRKTWQYEILTALRTALPEQKSIIEPIVDWCFKHHKNGFVIFADSIIKGNKKNVLKYIARYTKHPAISSRRIIAYDGSSVTFSYKAYNKQYTKTMPTFAFISAVLMHVSSKNFKTIRRFGLYARRSKKKLNTAASLLPTHSFLQSQQFDWRNNVIAFTRSDPLSCPHCKTEMDLYSITYYNTSNNQKTIHFDDWFTELIPPPKHTERCNNAPRKDYQLSLPEMSD